LIILYNHRLESPFQVLLIVLASHTLGSCKNPACWLTAKSDTSYQKILYSCSNSRKLAREMATVLQGSYKYWLAWFLASLAAIQDIYSTPSCMQESYTNLTRI